ncbi:MAG: hypothetical protein ACYDEA_04345 [Candidatus Dormibacteria bacterium]
MVTHRESGRGAKGRSAAQLSWEGETGAVRAGRRSRLVQLDRALEILEELNLRGEQTVPEPVRRSLESLGVMLLPRESPTAVLEKVLIVQEVYLLHPVPPLGKPWPSRSDQASS